jgi:hypothetical protein
LRELVSRIAVAFISELSSEGAVLEGAKRASNSAREARWAVFSFSTAAIRRAKSCWRERWNANTETLEVLLVFT